MAVIATVLTMSVTVQPRLRSFTGLRSPCRTGPIATACAERWTALYATLPGVEVGEDEDGRLARHLAAGKLQLRDARVDGGVVLDRALDLEVGPAFADGLGRVADGVDVLARPESPVE